MLVCQNEKWGSKVGDNLSGGVSKWEVVVKVVDNFNHWFVKMESGDQVVKNFTHHHL